ncbi:retrovirus-related pol polyprotein from transposon TNT 1-94 [Tanacetum coccineum]
MRPIYSAKLKLLEQSDWLADTDEEVDEQELEAHYSYMTKIQEVPNADSGTNAEPLEQVIPNSLGYVVIMIFKDEQNDIEWMMKRVALAIDYDKLERKLNDTPGLLAQKEIDIKEGLKVKAYEISIVKEKHDELVKQSLLTKSHYEGLVKEKTKVSNDIMCSYLQSSSALDEITDIQCLYLHKVRECDCLAQKLSEQTVRIMKKTRSPPDIQCAGSDTRPPMLDKADFASWQQRIRLYCRGKDNGVNILKSIDEGPFQMGTTRVIVAEGTEGPINLGPERPRVYSDLSQDEKDRYNADIRATNIILQGLPKDIYSLINHYTDAKDIWDNVKMLLEGSELTKEDRESQLYDDFEHFRQNKGETIHDYYVRFAKLINDMRNIKMTMSKIQLNSKFVNNMLPEWGRFVTAVKLNKGLKDSNFDQLYAYLKQHEAHANRIRIEDWNAHTTGQSTQNLIKSLKATVQDGRVVVQNVQGRQNRGQGNNARGAGAVGYGRAQNRVGNANPGQARQVKCYNCNGVGHIARNCTQPKRPQNSEYFKDKMLLMQAQENRVVLDEEQLLFLAGGQDNAIDEDVDEQPVQDLALNVDNVFQADDCDAYDSDVDECS